jgi:[ribosomal protein S18]-alanine N-acetyltransferase
VEPERQHGAPMVRRFRAEDIGSVMAILHESPEAASWSRQSFLEASDEAGALALVVETNAEITGFLMGRRIGDQGEVLNLAVTRSRRRRGQGTVLLETAIAAFRSSGALSVYLEVRESNTGAIAFYESHNFAKVGRRKDYYQQPTEAAVTMMRKLTA